MNARKRVIDTIKMSLLGSALFACQFVSGQELPKDRTELSNLSVRNQDTFLRDFGPVLKASGGIGRLYLYSECTGDSDDLFFPRLELKSGDKGKAGIDLLQDAFSNIKNVTVAERHPGIMGIWIGNISNDLLKTKIEVLGLKPRERYNELLAIKAIFGTSEVETKMREYRMDPAPMVVIHSIVDPDPKLPHLPASMKNLTVDEALDRIAQTFGGLVIYEECAGQNRRLFRVHMHEM
jgi:hypothetical protein